MAKSSAKNDNRRRPVIIIAIILAIGLPIYAGLFFKDYRGVPYGFFIAIVWIVGFLAAFILLLLYYALFVMPPHKNESWWEGVTMLWRGITIQIPILGGLLHGRRKPPAATISGEDHVPASFKELGAGILRSHQAVAIVKGGKYVRAAGPGFIRLHRGEDITHSVDLRPHLGIKKIDAMTRNGIIVKLTIFVKSQIHRAREEDPDVGDIPFKYHEEAVINVSKMSSIDDNNKATLWSEQIMPVAVSHLTNAVSEYDLNSLLSDPKLLKGISARTKEYVTQHFNGSGIEIMLVGSVLKEVPEEVTKQRLLLWQAPLQREIAIRRAEGDAEVIRRKKHARALAQIEIIQAIIQNIEEMNKVEQANLYEIVTLRMIEELEKAMGNDTLQRMVPEQMLARLVMETQGQMRELLSGTNSQDGAS